MTTTEVSIGQVKRDISQLVNRVAYGGERIVLTSRGKPKAVLISLEDWASLENEQQGERLAQFEAWLAANQRLSEQILAYRGGQPVDVAALLETDQNEREERDARVYRD
ncbi:MAG: type II toxin-antitoxin system Phd/YefM family antitoxin [Anaerolineae bacterium]|nr:type II toxin-antitoxin system Phd/YefM family antitoxin [Anaerolineae bacterium]MCO5187220.1 type II toxin-antitoxin system Phd/YefM family antitoxin [Anaerolineae bacterium]MCO5199887.1 type II toxin-antitoxin system Phd/YefM family antitoxin [Anaerolineae bacterium]MCO5203954.1 type II toxin-antitoxin system Phd/YefM family antitoxin [Anaerolineae bacterium]